MKNKGCKAIILVVLAVLVFTGLVLAAVGRPGRGGRPGLGFGPRGPGGYGMGALGVPMGPGRPGILSRSHGPGQAMVLLRILQRLDLTDEQNEQIKAIHNANKEKMEAAQKAITEATKALHEAVAEGADEATIRAAGTKLGNAVSEQAILGATTITSIKEVLTDEQLKKLKEFQEKMKDRIGKFRERMDDTAFRGRLRQRGAADWMGPYQGRGHQRGREIGRGRIPGWGWPEQGPPLRRR